MMRYKKLTGPVFVQVEVTTACTQVCTHCYNYWRVGGKQHESQQRSLTKEDADKLCKQLIDARVFRVILTGGEPLLTPDVVFRMASQLSKASIRVHLNSNLVLVDHHMAKVIASSGISSVLTSLMSHDHNKHDKMAHTKGAWLRTIAGVTLLRERNIPVGVNMVISTLNYDDIYKTGELVAKLTGRAFTATKAISPATGLPFPHRLSSKQVRASIATLARLRQDYGLSVDVLEHYPYCLIGDLTVLPQLTERRCSAGITSCTIGSDGLMRPCSHTPITYGNVFKEGMKKAWASMGAWRDGSLIPQECRKCKHLYHCSGGCRVEALVLNGSLSAMDPYAQGESEVIPGRVRYTSPSDFRERVVVVNAPIMQREEDNGFIVAGDGGLGSVTFISKETQGFLQQLLRNGPSRIGALEDDFDLDEESLHFLWLLLKHRVLNTHPINP